MSSRVSRRQALRSIAASVSLGGMSLEAAQHVHQHAAEAKKKNGVYKPQLFNADEYKTVARLTELILPADEVSAGAIQAGAPEFIDLIGMHNFEIGNILLGGVSWLDRQMERRYSTSFLAATPKQQTAMLDLIAYRKNANADTATGIRFFDWMRRLTADAFYTSAIGVKDLGYVGNKGMSIFQVPAAAIDYAVKKSGL